MIYLGIAIGYAATFQIIPEYAYASGINREHVIRWEDVLTDGPGRSHPADLSEFIENHRNPTKVIGQGQTQINRR